MLSLETIRQSIRHKEKRIHTDGWANLNFVGSVSEKPDGMIPPLLEITGRLEVSSHSIVRGRENVAGALDDCSKHIHEYLYRDLKSKLFHLQYKIQNGNRSECEHILKHIIDNLEGER